MGSATTPPRDASGNYEGATLYVETIPLQATGTDGIAGPAVSTGQGPSGGSVYVYVTSG